MPKTLDAEGRIAYTGAYWVFARVGVLAPLHALVVAGGIVLAVRRRGGSVWPVVGGVVAGLWIWTLFEYVFHRWMLHNRRTRFMRKVFWEWLHAEHHLLRTMKDDDHHGIHPLISLPVVLGVLAAASTIGSGPFAPAAAAGWISGYLAYETLHWAFHTFESGRGPLRIRHVRWLMEMHAIHHLVDARRNYGFVTLLWDRLFGTFRYGAARYGAARYGAGVVRPKL